MKCHSRSFLFSTEQFFRTLYCVVHIFTPRIMDINIKLVNKCQKTPTIIDVCRNYHATCNNRCMFTLMFLCMFPLCCPHFFFFLFYIARCHGCLAGCQRSLHGSQRTTKRNRCIFKHSQSLRNLTVKHIISLTSVHVASSVVHRHLLGSPKAYCYAL